jgi:hypothetical protein
VGDVMTEIPREVAKELVRGERAERRRAMEVFRDEGRYRRLVGKVSTLLLDQRVFDEWVMEKGDGDVLAEYGTEGWNTAFARAVPGFMRWLCAQAANGVFAAEVCGHYMQDVGLLGAFLTEVPERLEQYRRAQAWVVDGYVMEVVPLADEATPETLGVDKWRVEARMKVAAMVDPERFGKKEAGLGASLDNLSAVLQGISERKQKALMDKSVVAEQ